MKKLYYILLLLIPTVSQAYDLSGGYFKFGLGLDNALGQTKMLAGGYQHHLISFFDYQLEAGSFIDTQQSQGIIGFGGTSIGVSVVTASGFYTKLFTGPALITQTDTRLSSILEFNDDFEFGMVDDRGVSIGIDIKHLSNAGIWPPNTGREWFLLKLSLPF